MVGAGEWVERGAWHGTGARRGGPEYGKDAQS